MNPKKSRKKSKQCKKFDFLILWHSLSFLMVSIAISALVYIAFRVEGCVFHYLYDGEIIMFYFYTASSHIILLFFIFILSLHAYSSMIFLLKVMRHEIKGNECNEELDDDEIEDFSSGEQKHKDCEIVDKEHI